MWTHRRVGYFLALAYVSRPFRGGGVYPPEAHWRHASHVSLVKGDYAGSEWAEWMACKLSGGTDRDKDWDPI